MRLDWDAEKDAANARKHGVPLSAAEGFDWSTALVAQDLRRDYGEMCMIALGYLGPRLHVMIYTDRGAARRVISLRRADAREVARYERY
ncbi:MAG: BrnT family toxin [Pseudomonadota bacterium]